VSYVSDQAGKPLRQRRQVIVRSVVVSVSANRSVRGLCSRVVNLSSRDACSSPHNVPYPAYPRVKRPSFAFALRSGESHTAMQRSFWAFSGKTRSSNAANHTSQSFRTYSDPTLEPLLWCLGLDIFRRWCEMVSDQADSVSEADRRGSNPRLRLPAAQAAPLAPLVYPLVYRRLPLTLGDSGYELAAEVGDVWDHAAPDQVEMG